MYSFETNWGATFMTPGADDAKRVAFAHEGKIDAGGVLALGGLYGLRIGFKVEAGKLDCGHDHWEVVFSLTLGFVTLVLKAAASGRAHFELHKRQEEKDIENADIRGLDELQQMAEMAGVPVERIIDTVPEPLRSEMLKRLDEAKLRSAPEVTSVVAEDLERIRKGE